MAAVEKPTILKPTTSRKTTNLNDEHDAALRAAVRRVLVGMGATLESRQWGVGGSQEIETLHVRLEGGSVTVEAETYAGLTVTGQATFVDEIARRVRNGE